MLEIKFLSIFDMTLTKSCTLTFLSTINAKSLSDFWKSDTEYFVFWSFKDFLGNLKLPKKPLKDQKNKYLVSDFQKSERDFAFIVDRKIKVQDLISVISSIDKNLISNIKVFDVYEGDNIPENQKSIAISVTIQSLEKTLTDNDLEKINNLIIETVENKTGAKIRS